MLAGDIESYRNLAVLYIAYGDNMTCVAVLTRSFGVPGATLEVLGGWRSRVL